MLAFLKSLPFVGIALLMAYGAHSFIVGNLNDSIDKLQMQVEQYVAQNVALQTAADLNENTIRSLEEGAKKEDVQIGMSQEDLAEDEKKLKDADLKDGSDTKDDDEKKLSTAAESSTSSTSTVDEGNEMSAFDSEIAKVAKQAGFNWSEKR